MPRVLQLLERLLQLILSAPVVYLYLLGIAAIRTHRTRPSKKPRHRFAVTIPAHNEAAVIGATVRCLRNLDYPSELIDIHVVADHCTDETATMARSAGAIVHERSDGKRGSKGAALQWLFGRVLDDTNTHAGVAYEAVVVFDADTRVSPDFLRVIDARLAAGEQVVQGQHVIRNPRDGWFPTLSWAMFLVDNRLQNLGRGAVGCSAKNMGDSICFRADLIRRFGWGEGLTDDYAFRQRLLLEGVKIAYEPDARGYGEAPLTWRAAGTQRTRWLRGTRDASRGYARLLLREAIRRRDLALFDGALQAHFPSFSTLTMLSLAGWLARHGVSFLTRRGSADQSTSLMDTWAVLAAALMAYPLFGLLLERAPARAYVAVLLGPVFVVWRTWLAVMARFAKREVIWIRTERRHERLGSLAQEDVA